MPLLTVRGVAPCPDDPRAVVVRDSGVSGAGRRVEERRLHGVHLLPRMPSDRDRAVRPVPGVLHVQVGLQPAEVVEHVGPAPARVAQGRPAVVVLRCSAQCEAGVGGGAPAHDPGPWHRDPAVELGIRGVAPVVADGRHRGVEHVGGPGGRVRVVGTGLDEQHRTPRVLAEPGGQHAAGRASTDHDDVVRHERTLDPCRRTAVHARAGPVEVRRPGASASTDPSRSPRRAARRAPRGRTTPPG